MAKPKYRALHISRRKGRIKPIGLIKIKQENFTREQVEEFRTQWDRIMRQTQAAQTIMIPSSAQFEYQEVKVPRITRMLKAQRDVVIAQYLKSQQCQ